APICFFSPLRARLHQREVKQSMTVVVGRPQKLAARRLLEDCGDTSAYEHAIGFKWLARAETAQRRSKRTDQEDRLAEITLRLLDCKRRDLPVVDRSLAHHAVNAETKLLAYFGD